MLNFALREGLERCVWFTFLLSLRNLTIIVSSLLPQLHHLGNWKALSSDKPPSAARFLPKTFKRLFLQNLVGKPMKPIVIIGSNRVGGCESQSLSRPRTDPKWRSQLGSQLICPRMLGKLTMPSKPSFRPVTLAPSLHHQVWISMDDP